MNFRLILYTKSNNNNKSEQFLRFFGTMSCGRYERKSIIICNSFRAGCIHIHLSELLQYTVGIGFSGSGNGFIRNVYEPCVQNKEPSDAKIPADY